MTTKKDLPDVIEACARAAYEVNRVYARTLGDTSFGPWENAPEWQKDTNRKGVEVALRGATPAQMHESWLEEKRRTGWVYGPVKDAEKKTHPCFLPYDQLPEEQRRKDALYSSVVNAMALALGELKH